jgi:hypothetical protein
MGVPDPDDLQSFGAGRLVSLHEILRMQVIPVMRPFGVAISRLDYAHDYLLVRLCTSNNNPAGLVRITRLDHSVQLFTLYGWEKQHRSPVNSLSFYSGIR